MNYRGLGPAAFREINPKANVGLMQAVNRFEPRGAFRFATYATGGSGPLSD